jgi:hypothetical protein
MGARSLQGKQEAFDDMLKEGRAPYDEREKQEAERYERQKQEQLDKQRPAS